MSLRIISLKINGHLNLGSIGEKKQLILDNLLNKKYPQKQNLLGGVYAYINPVEKSAVIVTPGQININIDSEVILQSLSDFVPEYIEIYTSIANEFMVDDAFDSMEIDFGGLVDAFEKGKKAAAIKSTQKFTPLNKKSFEDVFPKLLGVGLRFIDEDDNCLFDAKIEPYLSDLSKFYLGFNIKSKQKVLMKDLEEVIKDQIIKFEKFFSFAKDNFLL